MSTSPPALTKPCRTGANSTIAIQLLLLLFPWPIRRQLLKLVFGYSIDRTAYIGFSLIAVDELDMAPEAVIGHLNLLRGMRRVEMARRSVIGRYNWITASPEGHPEFAHEADRVPELIMAERSAITARHIVDCSNRVSLGHGSTVAGSRSQILTHKVDLTNARQSTAPTHVGEYVMVGAQTVILPGAIVPDRSAIGPGSTFRGRPEGEYVLFSGVPAVAAGTLNSHAKWYKESFAESYWQRGHQNK